MLLAENVLMATGLLEPPTATHVRAARGLLADLKDELLEAIDREEPGRLYVCPARASYFDRLSVAPVYDVHRAAIEPLLGTAAADAYVVLHTQARQTLLDLRPASTIDTVLGPRPMPLDSISEGRWALEVDVVEGLRICKDIAAGALLKEETNVFMACFPESYAYLVDQLDRRLNQRSGAIKTWMPPMWLADSIRVFERTPFGQPLEIKGPKEPDLPPPKKGKRGSIDIEALKPKSQQT